MKALRDTVTIIVPAYNARETIRETLESLLAQSYSALEVIVVDDGSSDGTEEIAKAVCAAHPQKLRYVRQVNAGQAAALNNGWNQAKGVYLGYLSADDILYPFAIETLVSDLEKTKAMVVYPDYDLIDANSKVIRKVLAPEFSARELIEESVCQPGPGALFRREAFTSTAGWRSELRLTPDFDFWLRVSRVGAIRRLNQVLAGFRVHESSQSFAAPSESKSEEPHQVLKAFFETDTGSWDRNTAMAWAHTLSARLHLRAGRWMRCASHLKKALMLRLSIVLRQRFWHLLASGALGRLRYRMQGTTIKSLRKS